MNEDYTISVAITKEEFLCPVLPSRKKFFFAKILIASVGGRFEKNI